ncbi:MAG TPA: hypothetical protein VMW62_02480, partial [Chloroflexota bacterium]|nr:hypothetical protein [Chloroflexota bacterium]
TGYPFRYCCEDTASSPDSGIDVKDPGQGLRDVVERDDSTQAFLRSVIDDDTVLPRRYIRP